MARSPLFARLVGALRRAAPSPAGSAPRPARGRASGEPRAASSLSRRAVLQGALGAGLGACGVGPRGGADTVSNAAPNEGRGGPRVAVVGAGLAGSVAAWRLQSAGVRVELFDANSRVGGRAFTLHQHFPLKCELGGELIDTRHVEIQRVINALGLNLVDVHAATAGREPERYFMGGVHYTEAQIIEQFRPIAALIDRDLERLGPGLVSQRHHNPAAESLDALSTAAWLDRNGLRTGPLRALLDVAFTSELGRDLNAQSALGFLYTIGRDTRHLRLYGDSDERFVVREGSDAIARRIAERLGPRVSLDHALVALDHDGARYTLSFDRSGSGVARQFDRVIVALPFHQLRRCRLGVALPPLKRRVIDELSYGTNAKVMIAVRNRPWQLRNASGTTFSDSGVYHESWDSSRGFGGDTAIMTAFSGGRLGVAVGESNPEAQGRRFADALDLIFEGTAEAFLNRAARMHWPTARWFEGSYACYGPGDYCRLGGLEAAPVGGLFFAGEHTSTVSPGYLNGAVESGERAAREALESLGVAGPR